MIHKYTEYHTSSNINKSSEFFFYIREIIQAVVDEVVLSQANCLKTDIKYNVCTFAIYLLLYIILSPFSIISTLFNSLQ